ncbi:hypothetical protein [Brevundimonas sp.]|uniref:hypothetical protein n=1 Tax=Brevundimonas sp. TaxID=1871086 RepID=UPI002628A13A|nr:hypothetical protein [Brevundimonas sp.]
MKMRSLAVAALTGLLMIGGCGKKDEAVAPRLNATQQAAVEHAPPPGKALSPGGVNKVLTDRGFTPEKVRRRGSTYVVDAVGKTGNKVRLVIDGKAGQIKGLDVIRWAPGAKRIAKGSRGATFVNDTYEFGYTLPDSYFADWINYQPAQWQVWEPWIDYGDEYVIDDWNEVYYEDFVDEISYAEWVDAYGEIPDWSDASFYDDSYWDAAVEEYYAANADAFAEDYGYEYAAEVFEEDYYAAMVADEMAADQAAQDEVDFQQQVEAERDVANYEAAAEAEYQQQIEAERDVANYDAAAEAEYQQQVEAERDAAAYENSGYEEPVEDNSNY